MIMIIIIIFNVVADPAPNTVRSAALVIALHLDLSCASLSVRSITFMLNLPQFILLVHESLLGRVPASKVESCSCHVVLVPSLDVVISA